MTTTISPLFNHLSIQIEQLIESVEFEESVFLLEGFKSALIKACDPSDIQFQAEEFKRVILVLQTIASLLSSGAIPQRGTDNKKILQLCNIANLPTEELSPGN